VVIALPLILHAPVVIDALNAGKHVWCEKLMAWDIGSCKKMIEAADKNQRILTIGHQRHYSLLYAHAEEVLRSGILGDVKHIRALWHRNNTWPRLDKDGNPVLDPSTHEPELRDSWKPDIPDEDRKALENDVRKYGFQSMEELVRWRLFNRTAAGLMAELGSHQLDACSIFLGKVHPLAVSGFGGKFFYHDDRQTDDHVFVTFEFPGPNYWANPEHTAVKDKSDIVVVTYSSINTNSFEPYGECVMGTRGTMIVEQEQSVLLYPEKNPNKPVAGAPRELSVTVTTGGGGAVMDASASTGPSEAKPVELGQGALGTEPISRGYREEMEHFAYCIKMHQLAEKARDKDAMRKWELEPKCHGRLAMADAIIALTANQAMHENRRIEFQLDWIDADNMEAVPDQDRKPQYIKG
jgi:predicted dehydrogenase